MKIRRLLFLLLTVGPIAFGAEQPKPFQTIDLSGLVPPSTECRVKWRMAPFLPVWMDNAHLALELTYSCLARDRADQKFQTKLVVWDTSGQVVSVDESGDLTFFRFLVLPSGLALLEDGQRQVKIVDSALRAKQTLECPAHNATCEMFTPSSSSPSSDFALCSDIRPNEVCDFYRGRPALITSQEKFPFRVTATDPYNTAISTKNWRLNQLDVWYFDGQGNLASESLKTENIPVPVAHWAPKNSACSGELSSSEPRRFLAVCAGTHFYTDGSLDNIFGYSKIALFDVASRSILARIDGPEYVWPALSPSGTLIAVLNADKIHLYRVN